MRTPRLSLALALLLTVTPPARAGDSPWFPFVIPWDDATPRAPGVADLNPTPAGAGGFVTARDGHFFDARGKRVRFLGVNLCYNANLPHKADAEKLAARLHKYGVNIVRLHQLDAMNAPGGIFDPRYKDSQHLDAGQLDRLDHLVYQLKRHGIYVNLGLLGGRHFTPADGCLDPSRLYNRGLFLALFEPRYLALQTKYARDLLTHLNPYTKTRYAEEPAVAFIELTNENTLLGAAWHGGLDKLPPAYRDELARQWNAWLKARHRRTEDLKVAWKEASAPLGPELARNGTFGSGTASWNLEKHEGARAEMQGGADAPAGAGGRSLRVRVTQAGKEAWHVQLQQPGLDLRDGETYTVAFWAKADRKRPVQVSASLDNGDWHNVGLSSAVNLTTDWQPFRLRFPATRAVAGHGRLVVSMGTHPGTVEVAGVSLRSGGEGSWPAGAALEAGTVPLGRMKDSLAGRDWAAFLVDAERRYLETMRAFLKKDLGVRAGVIGSTCNFGRLGGLVRERGADFADAHGYWEHPRFPNRVWDAADWTIPNRPLTAARDGGTLASLARHRLAGLPFSVSEYNHPAPNDYQAECLPLLAAFAARQDWDALYLFDYCSDRDAFKTDRITGFFSVNANPAKMAFFPAAATLFLRADVPPAAGECRLVVPEGSVPELLVGGGEVDTVWAKAACSAQEMLNRRVSVGFAPGAGPVRGERTGPKEDNGPLRWEGTGTDRALFTADAPCSKVVVGFLRGRKVELSGWQVEGSMNGPAFAALTLTARDGKAADSSRSLLLTAVARVENQDMGWNAKRTTVGKRWGSGPTRAEGVLALVTLQTKGKAATVYALDSSGRRQWRVQAQLADGRLTFRIGPTFATLWYEIVTDAP